MAKNTPSLDLIPENLGAFIRDIEKAALVPAEFAGLPEYVEWGTIHKTYKAFCEMRKVLETEAAKRNHPEGVERYSRYLQLPETTGFAWVRFSWEDQAEYKKMEKATIRDILDTRFGGTKLAIDALADNDVTIRETDRLMIRSHVIQKMGTRSIRMNEPRIKKTYTGKDYFSMNEQELGVLFHYIHSLVMASGKVETKSIFGFTLIKTLYDLDCLQELPEVLGFIRENISKEIFDNPSSPSHKAPVRESAGLISRIWSRIWEALSRNNA